MVKRIELTGKHGFDVACLVDDDDYETVKNFGSWIAIPARKTIYARAYVRGSWPSPKHVYLHSYITGWPLVDHVNRNGLDNRRTNLRPVSGSENQQNRRLNTNNTSGYRGVSRTGTGRWAARLAKDGRRYGLGWHPTPEAAAQAYNEAATRLYGPDAALNELPS